MKKNGILLYEFPDTAQPPSVAPPVAENGVTNGIKIQQQQNGGGPQQNGHHQQLDQRKRLPFAVVGSTHVKETLVGGDRASKQRTRVSNL